ncbi:MAG: DUF3524 domain-containing protein [Pseudomonadota bacterium]
MAANDLTILRRGETGPRLVIIEPYANASHRALVAGLMDHLPARWTALLLPGRHFRWRLRGAAAYLAEAAAQVLAQPWDGLICSAMLNLAELKGLTPALAAAPALAYFHENQLAYPAPGRADARQQERDLFLAWSNLTTAAAAKIVAFNSGHHRSEFLSAGRALVGRLPDAAPSGLLEAIAQKSRVLAVPIDLDQAQGQTRAPRSGPLRILWNHRWHHDKDPEAFFAALMELDRTGLAYELAVLGPASGKPPAVFTEARPRLAGRIAQWGAAAARADYWRWLWWADGAVSTAVQEYQGLSVAEAAAAGCRLLLPRTLVYPELYPADCLYEPGQLAPALAALAAAPEKARQPHDACRQAALTMTWPAQAEAWRAALAELLPD